MRKPRQTPVQQAVEACLSNNDNDGFCVKFINDYIGEFVCTFCATYMYLYII